MYLSSEGESLDDARPRPVCNYHALWNRVLASGVLPLSSVFAGGGLVYIYAPTPTEFVLVVVWTIGMAVAGLATFAGVMFGLMWPIHLLICVSGPDAVKAGDDVAE